MSLAVTVSLESDTFRVTARNRFLCEGTVTWCTCTAAGLENSLMCSFGAKSDAVSSAVQRGELKQCRCRTGIPRGFPNPKAHHWSMSCHWGHSEILLRQGPLCQIPPWLLWFSGAETSSTTRLFRLARSRMQCPSSRMSFGFLQVAPKPCLTSTICLYHFCLSLCVLFFLVCFLASSPLGNVFSVDY